MPHFRFRGCDEHALARLAPALAAALADAIGCPPDWVTLEAESVRYLTGAAPAFVEVVWFERGPMTRDAVVAALLTAFAAHGLAAPTVLFRAVVPADYYEDGRALA